MKMEDIARLSGVSRQTVSAVLNNKSWVSDETKSRVLKIIREHNYKPDAHAVSLAGKGTKLIGVVLRDISNPFYNQLSLGVERVLRESGYSLLYCNSFEDHDREVSAVQDLLSYNADGFIISPVLLGVDLGHLWHLHQRGKPVVSIDKIPGVPTSYIDFDNETAAKEAANYLIELGHRRIGHLKGPETSASAAERLQGIRAALAEQGIKADPKLFISGGTPAQERLDQALKLLNLPEDERPTAIICFNDLMAISLYQAAHSQGLRIPEDISVIGFDDIEIASLLGPPLTTVSLHAREVGEKASQMLLEVLEGQGEVGPLTETLKPELVLRDSVATLK